MKITFNSPVILTYTFIACIVQALSDTIWPNFNQNYFSVAGTIHWAYVGDYFRMFSYVAGHAGWEHLIGNFSIILLIGPILEERYGWKKLLLMILATAAVSAIFNSILFDSGIIGASGVAFMMILLSSMVNFKSGTIPLTFILIACLYLGREIYHAFGPEDNISQFGHIIGGVIGTGFGYIFGAGNKSSKSA